MPKARPRLRIAPPPAPATPKALRPATVAWVESVREAFELQPHHEQLLEHAAVALDRAADAREVLDRDGATFRDRFGQPRERPEVRMELQYVAAYRLAVRELQLTEPPADGYRAPRLGR